MVTKLHFLGDLAFDLGMSFAALISHLNDSFLTSFAFVILLQCPAPTQLSPTPTQLSPIELLHLCYQSVPFSTLLFLSIHLSSTSNFSLITRNQGDNFFDSLILERISRIKISTMEGVDGIIIFTIKGSRE